MHTQQNVMEKITQVLQKYPVKKASLFGSYARGDFRDDSDVDILIDFFSDSPGLMFFSLSETLEKNLNLEVDMIWERSLKRMEPMFVESVERERIDFYEKNTVANS